MPNPLIDESMILGVLSAPVNPTTIAQLQSGAVLSTADGFDRKLQRPAFVELISTAYGLHTSLGRLASLISVLDMMKAGDISEEKIAKAVAGLTEIAEKNRDKLVAQMELVIQCPWEDDQIH